VKTLVLNQITSSLGLKK